MNRRLAAIMFTDMQGYSALAHENESQAMDLLVTYRRTMQTAFDHHRGKVVKTMGDGFLVEFASATDAVNSAVEAQTAIHEVIESGGGRREISPRIGIHLGEVLEHNGDILGDGVNIASRVEPLSDPGGICITRQVFDQVHNKVSEKLVRMGEYWLKNISTPIEVYKVSIERRTAGLQGGYPDGRRLAVLPLLNMTADPDDQYFADGMTEELISTLSRVKGLTVIARTSVMRYKGMSLPTREICRELMVGSLLEGSVRKSEKRVRITEQLIDGRTEGSLWSQTYDRDLDDVFAIQSDIAQQVADALKVQLLSTERDTLEARPTESSGAYTSYLRGRYCWNERTKAGNDEAVKYLEEAIRLDPKFGLAYAGLADCYVVYANYGWRIPREAYLRVKEYSLKTIEMNPGLAEPHAVLGTYYASYEHEWEKSDAEYARAEQLNPSYATTHQWRSLGLRHRGRFDEAYAEIRRAIELDPLSRVMWVNLGETLLALGRSDEAAEQLARLAVANPDYPFAHRDLCWMHYLSSRMGQAVEEMQKARVLSGGDFRFESEMAALLGLLGRTDEADGVIAELEDRAKSTYVDKVRLGVAVFSVGRVEEAFRLIEAGYQDRSDQILDLNWEPWLKDLRKDSRWTSIRKRLRLSES